MNKPIEQVGGNHYQILKIQPRVFWSQNNLPSLPGAVVKHITRYKDKNGLEDLAKAKQYLEFMIEDYFDAKVRIAPAMWNDHFRWNISPDQYCDANGLSREQRAVIRMACLFSCREHLVTAVEIIQQLSFTYALEVDVLDGQVHTPIEEHHQIELSALRSLVARKNQTIYVGLERVREYRELAQECIAIAVKMQQQLPTHKRAPTLQEESRQVLDRIDSSLQLMYDEFKITAHA